jgi:hypothetical protein
MHFTSFLSATLVSLSGIALVRAQDTANLTASLTTYSTNQCCGGSITYNKLTAGQCVPSAGHPSVYGASVTIKGFWGYDVPGGNDHLAYGYLTGFTDSKCQEKIYEIKWDGCTSVSENNRARSWMWTQETYTPWWRVGLQTFNGTNDKRSVESKAPTTEVPTWLSFFDAQLGRERRVWLNREASEVERILGLYEAKDYAALSELE